jgi:hypothetical protein
MNEQLYRFIFAMVILGIMLAFVFKTQPQEKKCERDWNIYFLCDK